MLKMCGSSHIGQFTEIVYLSFFGVMVIQSSPQLLAHEKGVVSMPEKSKRFMSLIEIDEQ